MKPLPKSIFTLSTQGTENYDYPKIKRIFGIFFILALIPTLKFLKNIMVSNLNLEVVFFFFAMIFLLLDPTNLNLRGYYGRGEVDFTSGRFRAYGLNFDLHQDRIKISPLSTTFSKKEQVFDVEPQENLFSSINTILVINLRNAEAYLIHGFSLAKFSPLQTPQIGHFLGKLSEQSLHLTFQMDFSEMENQIRYSILNTIKIRKFSPRYISLGFPKLRNAMISLQNNIETFYRFQQFEMLHGISLFQSIQGSLFSSKNPDIFNEKPISSSNSSKEILLSKKNIKLHKHTTPLFWYPFWRTLILISYSWINFTPFLLDLDIPNTMVILFIIGSTFLPLVTIYSKFQQLQSLQKSLLVELGDLFPKEITLRNHNHLSLLHSHHKNYVQTRFFTFFQFQPTVISAPQNFYRTITGLVRKYPLRVSLQYFLVPLGFSDLKHYTQFFPKESHPEDPPVMNQKINETWEYQKQVGGLYGFQVLISISYLHQVNNPTQDEIWVKHQFLHEIMSGLGKFFHSPPQPVEYYTYFRYLLKNTIIGMKDQSLYCHPLEGKVFATLLQIPSEFQNLSPHFPFPGLITPHLNDDIVFGSVLNSHSHLEEGFGGLTASELHKNILCFGQDPTINSQTIHTILLEALHTNTPDALDQLVIFEMERKTSIGNYFKTHFNNRDYNLLELDMGQVGLNIFDNNSAQHMNANLGYMQTAIRLLQDTFNLPETECAFFLREWQHIKFIEPYVDLNLLLEMFSPHTNIAGQAISPLEDKRQILPHFYSLLMQLAQPILSKAFCQGSLNFESLFFFHSPSQPKPTIIVINLGNLPSAAWKGIYSQLFLLKLRIAYEERETVLIDMDRNTSTSQNRLTKIVLPPLHQISPYHPESTREIDSILSDLVESFHRFRVSFICPTTMLSHCSEPLLQHFTIFFGNQLQQEKERQIARRLLHLDLIPQKIPIHYLPYLSPEQSIVWRPAYKIPYLFQIESPSVNQNKEKGLQTQEDLSEFNSDFTPNLSSNLNSNLNSNSVPNFDQCGKLTPHKDSTPNTNSATERRSRLEEIDHPIKSSVNQDITEMERLYLIALQIPELFLSFASILDMCSEYVRYFGPLSREKIIELITNQVNQVADVKQSSSQPFQEDTPSPISMFLCQMLNETFFILTPTHLIQPNYTPSSVIPLKSQLTAERLAYHAIQVTSRAREAMEKILNPIENEDNETDTPSKNIRDSAIQIYHSTVQYLHRVWISLDLDDAMLIPYRQDLETLSQELLSRELLSQEALSQDGEIHDDNSASENLEDYNLFSTDRSTLNTNLSTNAPTNSSSINDSNLESLLPENFEEMGSLKSFEPS